MTALVAVQRGPRYGYVVVCSRCGLVARRELQIDADAKAVRHQREHEQHGRPSG